MKELLGALGSVRLAMQSGLLVRVEDLVAGQVFDDMLEQADYLHEKRFDVAAAVIARGVLEEHLRRWCQFASFTPASNMIDGFNQALYKGQKYDKAVMKHVDAMAAIGNLAAHEHTATKEGVQQMLADVRRFLAQHPVG